MKSEGIGNKVLLIVMLCAALGLFLYVRPQLFAPEPQPRLIDRLPESDVVGRFYLLDIARETTAMLYKNKVPFREFMAPDFLLSQAKNYGLDLQQPGYFFSDTKSEFGFFSSLLDSGKVQAGITRLSQFMRFDDTLVFNKKVKTIPKLGIYFYYDKSYLFVYHGNKFKNRFAKVLFSKFEEIESSWKRLKLNKYFEKEKLVVMAQSKQLRKYGIEYGLFAHDSDSLKFRLKAFMKSNYDLKMKLKPLGQGIEYNKSATKSLNIHLDISEFKLDKKHPLYLLMSDLARKISFPTDLFLKAWDGDLSYQEGGTQLIEEEIIEMGYDEEFNAVEIRKTKQVPVTGFNVLMSVNEESKAFVNALFAKGIINKQGKKYHFLFSPPLQLNIQPNSIAAYTSKTPPKNSLSSSCSGLWVYKQTSFEFQIDSLKRREVYGTIEFPVNRLLKKSNLF